MTLNAFAATPEPDLELARELLRYLHVDYENNTAGIVKAANEHWGRKPGMERWELSEPRVTPDERKKLLKDFDALGIREDLAPTQSHYRYAIILGGAVPRMKRRLGHFINLWQQGLRTDEIVFLTGQRPLIPEIDKIEELTSDGFKQAPAGTHYEDLIPQNETEAAKLLFHTTKLPTEMRQVAVTYIDTPRFLKNGHWERPYTALTAYQWLQTRPEPGSVLAFSDQPHAAYQFAALREYIPKEFKLEVTASAASAETTLAEYLDALALWLQKCYPIEEEK